MSELKNLNCELISNEDISYLEGKLKTFIESMGLLEKQEKATKDVLTTILWDWYCFIRDHSTDHKEEKRCWYYDQWRLRKIDDKPLQEV